MVDDLFGLQFADVDSERGAAEVVRPPVGHAAAGIVAERSPTAAVGAEVAVATRRIVGRPRRGAEPHVPVDLGRTVFGRQIAELRERADVDVDRLDRAQFAAPALVDDSAIVFQHALAAAGNDAAVAARRLDHQRAFAQRERLGLLAVDVLAVAAGLDDHDGVPVVGRGDMHGVDVGPSQQLAEVVVAWQSLFL